MAKPTVNVVVDENKNVVFNFDTMSNYSFKDIDKFIGIIHDMNRSNCYKRASSFINDDQNMTVYNFHSISLEDGVKATNDISLSISNNVLDEQIDNDKTRREILDEECIFTNSRDNQKEITKSDAKGLMDRLKEKISDNKEKISSNKEQIKKVATKVVVGFGIVAVVVGTTNFVADGVLNKDSNFYNEKVAQGLTSIVNHVDDMSGNTYDTAPIEYQRDHDEDFLNDKKEAEDKERAYEEQMASEANATENVTRTK